jgi:hypothetical protein
MGESKGIEEFARLLQTVVAPVFLLMGVSGLLGVMTSRLSRVIDRSRVVKKNASADPSLADAAHRELAVLALRAKLVSASITLCTVTAILVCSVIATVFLGAFGQHDTSTLVAVLFVAAMVTITTALLIFLREIFVATRNIHIEE